MKQDAWGGEILVAMLVIATKFRRRIGTIPRRNGVAGGGRLQTQIEFHIDDTYELPCHRQCGRCFIKPMFCHGIQV